MVRLAPEYTRRRRRRVSTSLRLSETREHCSWLCGSRSERSIMILPFLLLASVLQPEASKAPYRQPQLAAGHGLVVLTFAQDKSIYLASSRDQVRTFSQPTKIAAVAALAAGRHRRPRAAILEGAILISAGESE